MLVLLVVWGAGAPGVTNRFRIVVVAVVDIVEYAVSTVSVKHSEQCYRNSTTTTAGKIGVGWMNKIFREGSDGEDF